MTSSKEMPPKTGGFGAMFIKNQFLTKLPDAPKGTNLSGKVAVITGASSGLGLESGRQLLTLGLSRLVLAVRSLERGKEAATKLQRSNPQAQIDVWLLEMESYQSVQAFAQRCENDLPRIDIVILNAGIAEMDFGVVASTGHEKITQVNYLSTVLLAVLFLPIFKAKPISGTPPRLTIVSSVMSSLTKLPNRNKQPFLASFDDTNITPWNPTERYNASKLLGQLFLSRLADHVNPKDVTINMVEPGLVKGTGLFRNGRGLTGFFFNMLASTSARSLKEGALTYIDAAVVKREESHGCFLINCEIAPLAAMAYDQDGKILTDKVWEETLEEFSFAGARDIIQSFGKQA